MMKHTHGLSARQVSSEYLQLLDKPPAGPVRWLGCPAAHPRGLRTAADRRRGRSPLQTADTRKQLEYIAMTERRGFFFSCSFLEKDGETTHLGVPGLR